MEAVVRLAITVPGMRTQPQQYAQNNGAGVSQRSAETPSARCSCGEWDGLIPTSGGTSLKKCRRSWNDPETSGSRKTTDSLEKKHHMKGSVSSSRTLYSRVKRRRGGLKGLGVRLWCGASSSRRTARHRRSTRQVGMVAVDLRVMVWPALIGSPKG